MGPRGRWSSWRSELNESLEDVARRVYVVNHRLPQAHKVNTVIASEGSTSEMSVWQLYTMHGPVYRTLLMDVLDEFDSSSARHNDGI